MRATYSGKVCDGKNKSWKGMVTYQFRDNYSFENRDWQAIPGDPEATDYIFSVWQTYGDARPFKVVGEHKESKSFSASGSATGGGALAGGGRGYGDYRGY